MNIPKPPYYHGSSNSNAKNIINNGIIKSKLQSRDRGFFGDGFYVCDTKDTAMNHATTVSSQNPAILEIDVNNSANILFAGETFGDGNIKPQSNPSWHSDFINWSLNKVKKASVWEYATDKSEDEIIKNARLERTPNSSKFDRLSWYNEVTEYAEYKGYDVVYWTNNEIIIKNPDIINNFSKSEIP